MTIKKNKTKRIFLGLVLSPVIFLLVTVLSSTCYVYAQFYYNDNYEADNAEVKNLNSEINLKKDLIKKKQDQQEALKLALEEKQQQKATLNNELAILDNRLEKARLDVESTEMEIDKVDLEIKKTDLEIQDKNKEIARQKNEIATTLNLLHKQDGVSSLEVILLNNSLSEFLSQAKYLENINSEIKTSLSNIYNLKAQLEKSAKELDEKKISLNKLREDLQNKKVSLISEQEDKTFILAQTQSSEYEYQRLLNRARQEQIQASADISGLEKKVREKLSQLSKDKMEFNDSGMNWPVPRNTITAYFHDPDYPFRRVFEHPAVDIRAAQGTTLRAAASGYVARAKDSGMGYSYIMLVHGNGLSTVYGHVSRISVKEDEFVTQGQVIGASGGMPGTPGAGNMTTGAHLHFEVRLNGIPVNPLEYLP